MGSSASDSVDLNGVLKAVISGIWLTLILVFVGAFALGIRAWFAIPIYRSEAIVGIAEEVGTGVSGLMGGEIGAIATLAGVDIGGGRDRRAEYLALLTSKSLIRDFIIRENLVPVLFANRWDSESQSWRSSRWYDAPPPMDDVVEKFRRTVLNVIQDRQTGLITVRVEWQDRELAAKWVNDLISQVNEQVRHSEITEAQSSIDFLYEELTENAALQVRDGIYRLIEANLSRVVLANTPRQYALKVIDPPIVSDARRYVRPRMALELVLGAALGGLAGTLLSLWRHRRLWWPSVGR